jgi:hypothetical protein
LQRDSKTKDAAGLKPRMTSVFGKYQVINSEGDIVGTFAAKYEAEEVLRDLVEQWKRKRVQKDSQTKDDSEEGWIIVDKNGKNVWSNGMVYKSKTMADKRKETFERDNGAKGLAVKSVKFQSVKDVKPSPKQRLQGDSKTKDAKIATITQKRNGMYQGEIKGEDGEVESSTVARTAGEVHMWAKQHGADDLIMLPMNDFSPYKTTKQKLKTVARKLKNNRLGLGPGGGRRDGSGLAKGGNGMQSAGLGGRKQLLGDAETTIFSQQGYKIVKFGEGHYEAHGPSIPQNNPMIFREPDAARTFIIERMKRDGTYGKFGKDAKAKDSVKG